MCIYCTSLRGTYWYYDKALLIRFTSALLARASGTHTMVICGGGEVDAEAAAARRKSAAIARKLDVDVIDDKKKKKLLILGAGACTATPAE